MKLVINKQYGGFGLSHKGVMEYARLKGITLYPWIDEVAKEVYGNRATLDNPVVLIHYTTVPEEEYNHLHEEESKKPIEPGRYEKTSAVYFSVRSIARNDPLLIQVVETLGKEANGRCSTLEIIEIPDGVDYEIEEYDGMEWVSEKHRTWS